ncbi:MAG: glycosyltransferase, partial [Myxococcota bacterium]
MLPFVVFTRFNVGVSSRTWLKRKLELFRSTVFSSLAGQSDRNFQWVIGIDFAMPDDVRSELDAMLAPHSNFHAVVIDPGAVSSMRHASISWLQEQGLNHLFARGVITDPCAFAITAIIDDDDAWNTHTVALVRDVMKGFLSESDPDAPRGFLLTHTPGWALTLPKGICFETHSGRAVVQNIPFHSMTVFVLTRLSSEITACSSRHASWPDFAKTVQFETHVCDTDEPMWVYTRHGDTMSVGKGIGSRVQVLPNVAELLRERYAMDAAALMLDAEVATREQGEDRRPHQQLDAMYRIAAYNRQIRALQSHMSDDPAREAALREAMAE